MSYSSCSSAIGCEKYDSILVSFISFSTCSFVQNLFYQVMTRCIGQTDIQQNVLLSCNYCDLRTANGGEAHTQKTLC